MKRGYCEEDGSNVEKCNGNLVTKMGLVHPATEDYVHEAVEAITAGRVISVPTDSGGRRNNFWEGKIHTMKLPFMSLLVMLGMPMPPCHCVYLWIPASMLKKALCLVSLWILKFLFVISGIRNHMSARGY